MEEKNRIILAVLTREVTWFFAGRQCDAGRRAQRRARIPKSIRSSGGTGDAASASRPRLPRPVRQASRREVLPGWQELPASQMLLVSSDASVYGKAEITISRFPATAVCPRTQSLAQPDRPGFAARRPSGRPVRGRSAARPCSSMSAATKPGRRFASSAIVPRDGQTNSVAGDEVADREKAAFLKLCKTVLSNA